MAKEKQRMDLDDRIWGITGTVDPDDYKEPATGMDSDQDLIYVKYRPARKSKNAFAMLFRRFFSFLPGIGTDDIRRIPEAIPDKQVIETPTPSRAPGKDQDQDLAGQPNRKLVLKEDRDGNAAYEDQLGLHESNRINRLEKEKSRSESNAVIEQAEKTSIKSNDESKDKNQGRKRRHHRDHRRDHRDKEVDRQR